ncbi:MAG: hypothetical protein EPO23_02860 [Xanthobacteraceae bacterium]|nr:MAG: hypothetical protein EPO23_02860 [Xanthobacteraceae bacterium]
MSTSDLAPFTTDFQRWLAAEFVARGAFTVLAVLLAVEGGQARPLCSTSFQVAGDALDWDDIVVMFAGAGVSWDRVAFFPASDASGRPLDNPAARLRLRDIEIQFEKTPHALRGSHVFAPDGHRLADATAQVPQ